jgi:hypothetical protein
VNEDRPDWATWALNRLREAVERLAAPPEAQTAWLRETATYPSLHELALEFDDADQLLPELVTRKLISPRTVECLAAVDSCLAKMSGPSNLSQWEPQALSQGAWRELRDRAREAFATLPAPATV